MDVGDSKNANLTGELVISRRLETLSITIDDLLSWGPCRDYLELGRLAAGRERWTALDILALDQPPGDLLWVVLRTELIPERVLHELACDFAEHVLYLFERVRPEDGRPRAAIEAKRAWLRGEITDEQLLAAEDGAKSAAVAAAAVAAATSAAATSAAEQAERIWQLQHVRGILEREDSRQIDRR